MVSVKTNNFIFDNVIVRVSPTFVTEVHLDIDEAKLANISHEAIGEIVKKEYNKGQ